jgi:hypothetical protein
MFIQHLTEEAHAQAKLERKPRRNIQYKDVGTLTLGLLDHFLFFLLSSSFPSYLSPIQIKLYTMVSDKHSQPMPYHAEITSNF